MVHFFLGVCAGIIGSGIIRTGLLLYLLSVEDEEPDNKEDDDSDW